MVAEVRLERRGQAQTVVEMEPFLRQVQTQLETQVAAVVVLAVEMLVATAALVLSSSKSHLRISLRSHRA